jgi:Skp family chaperone for outer membrane proteins
MTCLACSACFANIGVVNIATCATESKAGKFEQEQFDKLKGQWVSLMQETEKEYKAVSDKLKNDDYLEGLSPKAVDELKQKQTTLSEDLMKYQQQLSQALNQANYLFIQKMVKSISNASEAIAKTKKLDYVINKEACFYSKPDMEITTSVIDEMNKSFEKEQKEMSAKAPAKDDSKKVAEAKKPAAAPTTTNKSKTAK